MATTFIIKRVKENGGIFPRKQYQHCAVSQDGVRALGFGPFMLSPYLNETLIQVAFYMGKG